MKTISEIAYVVMWIAIYRGITGWLGPEFMTNFSNFMFGPYVDLYNLHYRDMMPGWNNPFVIIIVLAIIAMMTRNWYQLTRWVAALAIALVFFDIAIWILDPTRAAIPDPDWVLYAITGFGWLLFSGALIEPAFRSWLRNKINNRS
ncbi:MAG: hypothetical protein JKY44_04625 [Flavobacteriaceae bacterium]|nr:hypothetical protein [Flavobacteriaceae bacterium]